MHSYTETKTAGAAGMVHSLSAGVWQKLHHLHESGCQLDLAELYRLRCPVLVENTEVEAKTPIVAVPKPAEAGKPVPPGPAAKAAGDGQLAEAGQSALFVLSLRMRVLFPVTVVRYELTADWLSGSLTCLTQCQQHRGKFCTPQFTGVRDSTGKGHLMTFGALPQTLQAGTVRRGLLLAYCPGAPFPLRPELHLAMTLTVIDDEGYRFRFPVVLQQGGESSSTSAAT